MGGERGPPYSWVMHRAPGEREAAKHDRAGDNDIATNFFDAKSPLSALLALFRPVSLTITR